MHLMTFALIHDSDSIMDLSNGERRLNVSVGDESELNVRILALSDSCVSFSTVRGIA